MLLILVATVPLAIIAGLLGIAHIEWIATGVVVIGTLFLIGFLTTPAVRFGLRIAPLPAGRDSVRRVPPMLVAGWGIAVTLVAVSGAEWQSLFVMCAAAPFAVWRLWKFNQAWGGSPHGKFVLFLRRFGKSADRLVGSAIRKVVSRHAALAFLIGKEHTGESWDPLVVGYDGMGAGTRTTAVPLYLEAENQEWIERVRALVIQADAVVIEITDWSSAMEIEAQIIRETSAADKTIVLSRRAEALSGAGIPARRVIIYHSSWRAAAERILWGFVASVLVPLVIHATITARENPDPLLAVPLLALWAWLFVRPLMDRESTDALASALGEILRTDPRAHPSDEQQTHVNSEKT